MAARIGLVCLAWWLLATTGGRLLVRGQCGGHTGWYGAPMATPVYSEEPTSQDVDGLLSFEEESLEYYPVRRSVRHHHQQQYRTRPSRYTDGSNYGYGNDYHREGVRDWEKRSSSGRKVTLVRNRKARRPVEGYSKSGRTDYLQQAPASEATSGYGERRKANRATKYAGEEYGPAPSSPPHHTPSLSFKVLPPKPSCAQNLLIGCTPTVTRVPCSAATHGGYGGAPSVPYYPPVPVHYNYHEPSTGYGYGAAPHPQYHQSPPAPAPAPAPTSEPYHHQPPPEGPHGGYAPSYKMSSAEQFPGFAAPVREELSESPKLPIISAFSEQPSGDVPTTTVASDTAGETAATVTTTTTATAPAATSVPLARVGVTVETTTPAGAGTTKEDFWHDGTEESSTDLIEGSTAR